MAENEKQLLDDLATLPKDIKADFLAQIQGAATAVRVMAQSCTKADAEENDA